MAKTLNFFIAKMALAKEKIIYRAVISNIGWI